MSRPTPNSATHGLSSMPVPFVGLAQWDFIRKQHRNSKIRFSGNQLFWKDEERRAVVTLNGIKKTLAETFWPEFDPFFAGKIGDRDPSAIGYGIHAGKIGADIGLQIHEQMHDYCDTLGFGESTVGVGEPVLLQAAAEKWRMRHFGNTLQDKVAPAIRLANMLSNLGLYALAAEFAVSCPQTGASATASNTHATNIDLLCWNIDRDVLAVVEIKTTSSNAFEVGEKQMVNGMNLLDSPLNLAQVQAVAGAMLFQALYPEIRELEVYVLWTRTDGVFFDSWQIPESREQHIRQQLLLQWWKKGPPGLPRNVNNAIAPAAFINTGTFKLPANLPTMNRPLSQTGATRGVVPQRPKTTQGLLASRAAQRANLKKIIVRPVFSHSQRGEVGGSARKKIRAAPASNPATRNSPVVAVAYAFSRFKGKGAISSAKKTGQWLKPKNNFKPRR